MRVLVLGAGVIGVTTAYELLHDGHEVIVIDRQPRPAAETSFANAGLLSPGHALPWAAPNVPLILLRSLYRNDQAFRMGFSLDPAFWRWVMQFLLQCRFSHYQRNGRRNYRLANYSLQRLQHISEETEIDFHFRRTGLLYLHRQQASLDRAVAKGEILNDLGYKHEVLDAERIAQLEPALNAVKHNFVGAIYSPEDGSGDCQVFTEALANYCTEHGVEFHYDSPILNFESAGDTLKKVHCGKQSFSADAMVLALGASSPLLAKALGIRLPIYPVKGYSLTFPIAASHTPPVLGGVDEANLCAFSRLGDQLRVTATAQFAGYDTRYQDKDFRHMYKVAQALFPEGADFSKPRPWACLRPMTPWGPPILGRAKYRNLFINAGHGHLGWTMAAGSARITADLLKGKQPEIPIQGLLFDKTIA